MARSRRANQARRRRRRRSRGSAAPWLIAILVVVLLIGGGVLLQSRGLLPEINVSSGGVGGELSSSRFAGSEGIEIPESVSPDWWWTRVVVDKGVNSPINTDGSGSGKFSRVLIPTDVLFGSDSSKVSDEAMGALRDIAATVTSPEVEVIVVCHSSRDGVSADRKPLSERRADEVARALEELLTRPAGSIERIGKGDEEPLPGIDQTTQSGLALNRRCEVYIGLGA